MKNVAIPKGVLLAGFIVAGCAAPEKVKNTHVDPAWLASHTRIMSQVEEGQKKVYNDLEMGRWDRALATLDELEPRWAPLGKVPHGYRQYRAEALIGQGDASQALSVLSGSSSQGGMAMTYNLARAMMGQLDPDDAFAHAEHARQYFTTEEFAPPPPMKRPTTIAEMVACVRLDRAVANQSSYARAEREARVVLKAYPNQPIASYILANALRHQNRWKESEPYWEAATVLAGPAGDYAKAVCHNLYPDRHEFDPPPPGPSVERTGPITPSLQAEIDRQRAFHEQFRRR